MFSAIPFVQGRSDCKSLSESYSDSQFARVWLGDVAKLRPQIPSHIPLWIDPGIDGLTGFRNPEWVAHIESFSKGGELLDDSGALSSSPRMRAISESFIPSLLEATTEHAPTWISVPQLAHANDASSNKANKELSKATGDWLKTSDFSGKLILPVIITSKVQLDSKPSRDNKIKAVLDSIQNSGSHGIWVVDSSIRDADGKESYARDRFPNIIKFHEELQSHSKFPNGQIRIAGPYWAMNLVLWARGLVDHPAISLGSGFRYYLSGGRPGPSNHRVALSALRMLIECPPETHSWLTTATEELPSTDPAKNEFAALRDDFQTYVTDLKACRKQINAEYRKWIDLIESMPSQGRAVGLYQDLSSAYVRGTNLSPLPKDKNRSNKPGQVAMNFMMNCLPH